MINRIIGVFKLDVNTFEAIEHDQSATTQAAVVVAIVAILSAIGSGIGASAAGGGFFLSFVGTLVWAFIGWFLWALVTYFVGTSFFGGTATVDEMLRVIGFAQAPLLLSVIPCIGAVIGAIWALIAGFIAVRQGLDLDNMKALLTIAIGFIVYIIGSAFIGLITGGASALLNLS